MKSITVYHYDAFSTEPNKGNPAGVVLNGADLTDQEMQEIAFKAGFNETAFLLNSDAPDLRIRYFTPGHEMNLCGHGTIASIYALIKNGLLMQKNSLTIETLAGNLPIKINALSGDDIQITMQQASPQFAEFKGSVEALADAIGLVKGDIDDALPILYGSTGIWTLLIPIKSLETFNKMEPNNELFPAVLTELPKVSLHPFCLETYDATAHMHARHFSSPYSGTIEDPVTGTASGVMGAYYAKYINSHFEKTLHLKVEQGQEMNKDGRVMVHVTKNKGQYAIEITGSAVYVKEFEVGL
ncbi:PhzF family phenazine biosynthesis protein [Neobacillus pocheonensis]|uniref:PhzF family phenazine biosynthesis isomerase n=1 Tax=Neobacillus pocheonensis TaxID=363869 RepID=UPI003D2A8F9D